MKKRNYIIIALCAMALAGVGAACNLNTPSVQTETTASATAASNIIIDAGAEDTVEKQKTPMSEAMKALENRNVFFTGMNDLTVTTGDAIQLENIKDNKDILISYLITDNKTGEELFKTDYIPAGQHVNWIPSESLEPGSYEISYGQYPVWMGSDGTTIPLTNANNVAHLTVK